MIKKICVFCASSNEIDNDYKEAARVLADELIKNNITLVYGGGGIGLMGELSNTMIKSKGKVIGIIPEFMMKKEWGNKKVSELIVVPNMHERKHKLIENADAIVALPGGCGTIDELTDVITLKQLGLFTKPIIIVNTKEFYSPFIELLNRMITEKFMREVHKKMWVVVNSPEEAIPSIQEASE